MNGEVLSEQEYDEKLDRLVDTNNLSYDEARQALGPPPYELSAFPNLIDNLVLVSLMRRTRQLQVNRRGITKVRAAFDTCRASAA